ncbi:hypothetical protein B0H13DRAFT_2111534 [Mycena leptocephala]|nr:hypothetical protein B0H13DRAFT_2111534 [Mycena leptocephala]
MSGVLRLIVVAAVLSPCVAVSSSLVSLALALLRSYTSLVSLCFIHLIYTWGARRPPEHLHYVHTHSETHHIPFVTGPTHSENERHIVQKCDTFC